MWIELLPSGKYKARERYIDPMTGKAKIASITIEKDTKASRKAAESLLRYRIAELTMPPSVKDMTFKELTDLYIEHQKKITKRQSWVRDESLMRTLRGIFGDDTLGSVLSARLIVQKIEATGKGNVTMNNYIKYLKKMLRWAYQNDYLEDVSYLQKIKNYPDNQKARIEDKYLSSDELKKLLEGMKITRWKLLTHFLALSGLRIGEAIALNDNDVTDRISVTKTASVTDGIISNSAKTEAGNREVHIQPELEAVIKEIRHFVKVEKMKTGNRSERFFPEIQYPAYCKYLKENSKAILDHQITPHALRHTHVSLLAENGYPLDAISRRVGHDDSEITKRIYLHITEKQKEKDNQMLDKIRII